MAQRQGQSSSHTPTGWSSRASATKGARERRRRPLDWPRPPRTAPVGRSGHVIQALGHGCWCIVAPGQ